MLPRYPGWISAKFAGPTFFSVGPPPGGNGALVVCLAVDLEKFHPKTAEAENSPLGPRGKKGVRWNMKILSVRKTFFLSVGKTKC